MRCRRRHWFFKVIFGVFLGLISLYMTIALTCGIVSIVRDLKEELNYKKRMHETKKDKPWKEVTLGEVNKECMARMIDQSMKGTPICRDCRYHGVCFELKNEDPWAWSNPGMRGEV